MGLARHDCSPPVCVTYTLSGIVLMELLAITAIVAARWVLCASLVLNLIGQYCHSLERLCIARVCFYFGKMMYFSEYMKHGAMLLHHGQDRTDSTFHHNGCILYEYNTSKDM